MDLEGKRIIVTGGAQGMGEATVRVYLAHGAKVASMDVKDDAGRAVIEEAGGDGAYFHADVSDRASVERAFEEAVAWLGGLDALAHVAGVMRSNRPEDVDDADWDLVMNINVRGTMLTNQAAFRAMESQGSGAIINFGSVSGLRPEPHGVVYSASKGAVHSWTRSAAAAWGRSGIRVNAILPIIATPMYESMLASMTPAQLEGHHKEMRRAIPLGGRYGDAEEDLGPVMVFFASDASRFVTGQLIPVDGGLTTVR